MKEISFTPIVDVVKAFSEGQMVIICDDADRENEGDLSVSAEHVTAEQLSFMMKYGRGLICTSIGPSLGERLRLPLQTLENNSSFRTPFAPSITLREYASKHGAVSSRLKTIQRMVAPDVDPSEFVSPGSVHPLLANPAGVVGRDGQTEGSYDLARLAGLAPAALICEVLADDGQMMRGGELQQFAERFKLPVTSVEQILQYRVNEHLLLREEFRGVQQTHWGEWTVVVFHDDVAQKEHMALYYGEREKLFNGEPVLARIHSECLTGDAFASARCDCGPQLHTAFEAIRKEGSGLILYLRQEGRGIGLSNKLKAYELQDQGRDTVEANLELGFEADERDYQVAVQMLRHLRIGSVRLLTNNPKKVSYLKENGISVPVREPIEVLVSEFAKQYMETKQAKLGHIIDANFS